MARDLPIANGSLYINFDMNGNLRELHFPFAGEENHAAGPFRIGIFIDETFHWLFTFQVQRDYIEDSLITQIIWENSSLGIKIISNDTIDFEKNIYIKKIALENLENRQRELKLFLCHDFQIYSNPIGDTAAYKPENKTLLHYKNERYFLINIFANNKFGIDEYATGNSGTWIDAEDGLLSLNPIAQGTIDSALAIPLTLTPLAKEICYSWISAGRNWVEVETLDLFVKKTTPERLFERTKNYWNLWIDQKLPQNLPEKILRLYKRSLFICHTYINRNGSIIAAADSDAIQFNRDTYSYVWPRDGALVANAMDLAGYNMGPFFTFIASLLTKDGYLLHKFMPSGALGSSWHPWVKEGKEQLPIQEDETALVIWALWKHFEIYHDLDLITPLYNALIKKSADFMMNYRDPSTGLPLPSFDLWEERQGVLTYTLSTVYGGLEAASNFASAFGDTELAEEYLQGAKEIKAAMEKYLFIPEKNRFARMINFAKDGTYTLDETLDASLYALFAFGAYSAEDPKVSSTMDQVFKALDVRGGIIRYENDTYYKQNEWSNPWFVTTLWKADYLIAKGNTKEALQVLEWVADHALLSGTLAEQLSIKTNTPLSVSPLTWSHGTWIATVQKYLSCLQ